MITTISSDLILLITQQLTYHDYVALMLCDKRLFQLLDSDRFLKPLAKRERLSIAHMRSGLHYLLRHPVYNYTKEMVLQPTYFRQYHNHLAVDIFDRLWVMRGKKLIKTQQRVKCAYRWKTMCWDGYLALTHKGTIIYSSWEGVTLLRKRVHALDLHVEDFYFIYHTKREYRVAQYDSDVKMPPLPSVHDGQMDVNSDYLEKKSWSELIDQKGTLWRDQELIAENVKRVQRKDETLYYLTQTGELHHWYGEKYNFLIQEGVKDYFFHLTSLYTVIDSRLHRLRRDQEQEKHDLPRSAVRIEIGPYDSFLIEYERR